MATIDLLDPDVDALDDALNDIAISSCSATGANGALDDVNEQETYILDYFVEDDLDFIDDVDWDRLLRDIDINVEPANPGSVLPSNANQIEDLEYSPIRTVTESNNCLTTLPVGTVERSFDMQSMTDFYAKGSSSPQRPERTPTPNQINRRQSYDGRSTATPRPTRQISKPSNWKIIRHVRSKEPN